MQTFALERTWKLMLRDLGVPPRRVVQHAGLPSDVLDRDDVRVSADQYFRLWEAVSDVVDVPNLGLAVGRGVTAEMFSPPLFAGLCSPDLATAAERLAQYKRLIGPCRMTVEHPEGELLLTFRPVGRAAFPPQYGAMEVTFWTHFARMGTRTELRPMEVQLPFELEAPEPFQDFFGVEVRRGLRPAIRFTELDARRPFLTHDEGMWSFFEPELRRRLTDVRDDATMAERVQAVLLELLPSGRTGMADVARSLGLSTRTLQRRLQRDGTRFQDVLATTRAELAHHYLSRSNMGGAEISFLLGYDDPNSFVRAFHQWTGQTPEGRRAELRAASYARQGG